MSEDKSITKWFGTNLAEILSKKILEVHPKFNSLKYIKAIEEKCNDRSYTQRIILHAEELRKSLPEAYDEAMKILVHILGEKNKAETGMFTNYYWIIPIGKFIELYGLDYYETSIKAIEEVTKRNTGEYAIRPFIRKYPKRTINIMCKKWSRSKDFHLRRLASEGCRPKLPWATKLDVFIDNPKPVFKILDKLMEDDIKFVQKSVANNIADYLKVNPTEALRFIEKYASSENINTKWILKNSMRNWVGE